jgi:hypothetical protein
MVTINDAVQIELTKEEVLSCLEKTKQNHFIDNLRNRHKNVQFDCKLRGYVGEVAIKKWFEQNGVALEATACLEDGDNIDIDFLVKGKNIELKTSLIPDNDGNLSTVIERRDIKLIKRRGNARIEDLRGDVHMQIYYTQKTRQRDKWLKSQTIDFNGTDEYLYDAFQAQNYLNSTFFVAWIDKPTLVQKINSMPVNGRCWSFRDSQRYFWKCKLNQSKKPIDIIEYLKSL